jgi:IS4 transposase
MDQQLRLIGSIAMRVEDLLERFKEESPVAVMARVTLEQLLDEKRLDELFERHAVQQKCGELLFSTVADLMGLVALKIKPSVNAAYMHRTREEVGVSIASIYNKLQGIEPGVGRALVQETAQDLRAVVQAMPDASQAPVLRGYKTRIVDGNHLAGTEHRIKELRVLGAAALPGQCIPILDPDHRLILDVIPCEDGHASECTLFPQIVALAEPGEVWIGDRRFGTQQMMTAIALDQRSHFIFRHSLSGLPNWNSNGRRRKIGQMDDAVLYEQSIEFTYQGRSLTLRRITVKLDEPTRKGDDEIHILTNLPKSVSARKVAKAYRRRWNIETAFQQLAQSLNSEIETLGYPQAALFSFCISLMMFNLLSTIKSAIASAKGSADVGDELSTYYIALEISESWRGLTTAINDDEFRSLYGKMTPRQLAKGLISIAKRVNLARLRKSRRGPKKPPPKRMSGNRGNHVATSRILEKSRAPS